MQFCRSQHSRTRSNFIYLLVTLNPEAIRLTTPNARTCRVTSVILVLCADNATLRRKESCMFQRFERSWDLTKQCWAVLSKNKVLILFPILSGLSSLMIVV